VGGGAAVIFVPAVLDPLIDIAVHVVETESVGPKRADGCGRLVVPPAAAVLAIGVIGADGLAPGISCGAAGPRRVFPFGFRQQAVWFAGLLRYPRHEKTGVFPIDIDDRLIAPPPALVARPVRTRSERGTGIPLRKRDFEARDREGPWNRDLMLRALGILAARLGGRRSHAENAGWDDDHLGAAGAFLEGVLRLQRALRRRGERRRPQQLDPPREMRVE